MSRYSRRRCSSSGIAELVGRDFLVEPGGVGPVIGGAPLLRLGLRRTVLGGLLGVARLALVVELGRRRLDRVHRALVGVVGRVVGRLALHSVLGLALFALAFCVLRLVRRRLLLIVRLIVRVGFGVVGEAERGQKLLNEPGVGALVVDGGPKLVELGPGLLLDETAPQIGQPLRARRRLEAGQALARQHRHRLLERRLLARAGLGERALVIAVVEHGGEVGGHPLHPPRADRLDAGLLDRVEEGARRRILRREAAMDRLAVAGEPEGEGIGDPAQDRRLARTGLARRLGQARLGPLRPGHQRRLVGGEGHFEFRMARKRPGAGGDRQLERVVRRVGLADGLAVAGRFDVDGGHDRLYASSSGASQGNAEPLNHSDL